MSFLGADACGGATRSVRTGTFPCAGARRLPPSAPTRRTIVEALLRNGHAAAQTGANTAAGSQHKVGSGYVALATGPSAQDIVARLADTFESHAGAELEERLIVALESVRDRGTNVRSVALIVFGNHDYSDTDLRVDLHDDPIAELRRVYDWYKPMIPYYDERARNAMVPRVKAFLKEQGIERQFGRPVPVTRGPKARKK